MCVSWYDYILWICVCVCVRERERERENGWVASWVYGMGWLDARLLMDELV